MSKTVVMGHIEASSLSPPLLLFLYFPFMYSSCVFSTLGPEIFLHCAASFIFYCSPSRCLKREVGIHIYHDTPPRYSTVCMLAYGFGSSERVEKDCANCFSL